MRRASSLTRAVAPRSRSRRVIACLLSVSLITSACHRRPKPQPESKSETPSARETKVPAAHKTSEVYATWYEVPANSLAKRRAGIEELTAAHNHLPIGTQVRVTHLRNGKSVIVRITDRGITGRKMKLDLCKEAAEQLDMVREGMAKVRMEILPPNEEAVKTSQPGSP